MKLVDLQLATCQGEPMGAVDRSIVGVDLTATAVLGPSSNQWKWQSKKQVRLLLEENKEA